MKFELWLNDTTWAARRECRRAELQWKKDKLQISYGILNERWKQYQKIVKVEKSKYLSAVIANNCHNPCVLFKTVDSILNSPLSTYHEASTEVCEKFLQFFTSKITNITTNISPPSFDNSIPVTCSAVLQQFEPVTLPALKVIVFKLKLAHCPTDILPPHLFKEVWETIGPNGHPITNSSLALGVVPASFKQALVHLLLKEPNLDSGMEMAL